LFSRFLISILLFGFIFTAKADEQVQFTPDPEWVDPIHASGTEHQTPVHGLRYKLIDKQINLEPQTVSRYTHYVVDITSTEGLEQASQLSFEFDPTYETLRIHQIHVIRNGEVLDRLEPQELRIFQREPDLEHFLYSGIKTAHLILPDIRVGDRLEYSFSLQGNNPVMDNKFSEQLQLDWEMPVELNSIRILVHAGRTLYYSVPEGKNGKLTMTETSTHRELLWQQSNVPAVVTDDDTPAWYSPHRYWALSEFSSWQDVVKWAKPIYDVAVTVDPTIQSIADQIMQAHSDEESRIVAALHFVQQEIRYLGVEDGIGSHLPRKASDTLYRRYGDCKDKTVLLMAILKAMNLSPVAALVNLDNGSILPKQLPSPYVFNHVIVTLQSEGKRLWLDGTDINQGSKLSTIGVPFMQYALLITDEETNLTSMQDQFRPAETVVTRELWFDEPVSRLMVTTSYSGFEAENQRTDIKNQPKQELGRDFLNYYTKVYENLEPDGLPSVVDSFENNQLLIRQSFNINGIFDELTRRGLPLYADLIDAQLKQLDSARKQPVALSKPMRIRQEFVFHLPYDINIADYNQRYDNDVFSFNVSVQQIDARSLKVIYKYYNRLSYVPVRNLALYREAVGLARDELSLNFTFPPAAVLTQNAVEPQPELH